MIYRRRDGRFLDDINVLSKLEQIRELALSIKNKVPSEGKVVTVIPYYSDADKIFVLFREGKVKEAFVLLGKLEDKCNPILAQQYGLTLGDKGSENLQKVNRLKAEIGQAKRAMVMVGRLANNYGNPSDPSHSSGSDYKRFKKQYYEFKSNPNLGSARAGKKAAVDAVAEIGRTINPLIKGYDIKDDQIQNKLYKAIMKEDPEKVNKLSKELLSSMQALDREMPLERRVSMDFGKRFKKVVDALKTIIKIFK